MFVFLQCQKESCQQLWQSQYGFYCRPFRSDSYSSYSSSETVSKNRNMASSFIIRYQLIMNVASSGQQQMPPADVQKDKTQSHPFPIYLNRYLMDAEAIHYSLTSVRGVVCLKHYSASTAGGSHSSFTSFALNGLFKASKLPSSWANVTIPATFQDLFTSHRWHHLLGTKPPLLILLGLSHPQLPAVCLYIRVCCIF